MYGLGLESGLLSGDSIVWDKDGIITTYYREGTIVGCVVEFMDYMNLKEQLL